VGAPAPPSPTGGNKRFRRNLQGKFVSVSQEKQKPTFLRKKVHHQRKSWLRLYIGDCADWNLQDCKMTDNIARVEFVGL